MIRSFDDLDSLWWLRPGEEVRWRGRPARARIPWLPVLGLGAGSLIAAGFVVSVLPGGPGRAIFVGFLLLIVAINLASAFALVRRARSAALRHRYVLTDQRAAIFEVSGRVVGEARADTAEFRAKRSAVEGSGDIDWGESDYQGSETTWRTLILMSSMRYSPGEGRLVFAELADFDVAYAHAAAVRAALGANTPSPVGPKVRGHEPVPLGALDTRVAGVLNNLALLVGGCALVSILGLLGWTLFGPAEDFMSSPALVLFLVIFPLFFWAIAITTGRTQRAGEPLQLGGRQRRNRRWNQGAFPLPLQYLPRWATGVVLGVFVLAWISFMTVFASHDLPGQPEYHPATRTYSANNHGDEIPLSKAQYERALRAQDRLFLSAELAFVVAGVGAASDEAIRRRRSRFSR